MKRKIVMPMFTLLIVMGFAFFFASQADSFTFSFGETTEFKQIPPDLPEEYSGPQTVQALMNIFDAEYNRVHLRTTITISADKHSQSSKFTNEEIDARYPRGEWLKTLLDKGFTIQNFRKYAYCLSKRHILAFLEDNPDFWKTGFHGMTVLSDMPVTDDWETYKAAYFDKLANKHLKKIRKAAEQAEQAKEQAESVKNLAEQVKEQAEQVKERAERVKNKFNSQQLENVRKQIENAKEQIERLRETLERLKKSMPPQSPNQNMKKKPSTIQI
ncbi:MAG: hypothetical protein OXI67_04835 [Candidatus Poribacteria bacterium]|nr:hypothetical protein [Candidatus Poribacteria bacterium]